MISLYDVSFNRNFNDSIGIQQYRKTMRYIIYYIGRRNNNRKNYIRRINTKLRSRQFVTINIMLYLHNYLCTLLFLR